MEQRSVRGFNMNRFLPFISCALAGILVSSCAQNPRQVLAYGSTHSTSHRPAKRHHVALAQVQLRHPPRRPASQGPRGLLRPWNHLPAASETRAPTNATTPQEQLKVVREAPAPAPQTDHLPTDPKVSTPPHTYEIRPPRYWRWEE
jgi:hypothetical protein